MKNLRLTVLILSIFVFITLSPSVFAKISSRIEGTVTDKDTGNPIPKAWVLLYRVDKGIVKSTQTNSKGYFRYETPPVFPGKRYYIRCTALGYAQYIPEYYFHAVKPEYFDEIFQPFLLEEGQIKHIRINLEKGGSLKGVLFVKDALGISPFKGVTIFLRKKKKPNEYFLMDTNDKERFRLGYTKTDELGGFIFHELEPSDDSIQDEYIIELNKFGYSLSEIKGIKIRKGIENELEYTADLTNPTGLKGNVKINGKIPIRGDALLYAQFPNEEGVYKAIPGDIDENGNYVFCGIPPGVYKLEILAYYSWNKSVEETCIIEITAGNTKVLDFNLEVKQ